MKGLKEHKTDGTKCWCDPKIVNFRKPREEVKRQLKNYGYCSECHMFGTPTPSNEVQCGNCGKFTLFMLKDFLNQSNIKK